MMNDDTLEFHLLFKNKFIKYLFTCCGWRFWKISHPAAPQRRKKTKYTTLPMHVTMLSDGKLFITKSVSITKKNLYLFLC